jgi:hypothetical protein
MTTETKRKNSPGIPQFKNETEEAEWHASAEGRAHESKRLEAARANGTLRRGTHPVLLKLMAKRGKTVPINIRLAAEDVLKAQAIADKKGVGYQTVLKMLLHEALAGD